MSDKTELAAVKKELAETQAILKDLLQEQGYGPTGAESVVETVSRGATPSNLRTIAILDGGNEEEKRKLAEGILYRIYRGWIQSTSDELVRCVIDNEIADGDSLRERLEQDVESALIYTHDQHMVIYAADGSSTDAGAAALDEYGADGTADTQLALWATFIYQHDVWDRLDSMGLDQGLDRDAWLEAARAGEWDDYSEDLSKRARRAAR